MTESEETIENHKAALSKALKALVLTRDYFGAEALPSISGWEWFDAACTIAKVIPEDDWTTEFLKRLDNCPICNSDTGIKIPNGYPAYCEDCGFPDTEE